MTEGVITKLSKEFQVSKRVAFKYVWMVQSSLDSPISTEEFYGVCRELMKDFGFIPTTSGKVVKR